MNIFDDYGNFIEENDLLIDKLKEIESPILTTFIDVLKVLDYVYEEYLAGDKIEEELIDIFDIGFGYFINVMNDLNTYYHDYFNDNFDVFHYYADLMIYHIYLDDFKCYLDNDEMLTPERKKIIEKIDDEIDDILQNKLPLNQSKIAEFDEQIHEITPPGEKFKPVYSVFLMITEELNIF